MVWYEGGDIMGHGRLHLAACNHPYPLKNYIEFNALKKRWGTTNGKDITSRQQSKRHMMEINWQKKNYFYCKKNIEN